VYARHVEQRGYEGRGQGSSRIQTQADQELTATPSVSSLTEKSSEYQIVDVTNKVTVNRYMRVFHYVLHFMVYNRTSSSTYVSE
jgi:hypothetical protein